MYRNFAYILSLIPQYQLHEVDSIFTSFFKNKKIGFKVVCRKSPKNSRLRMRLNNWLQSSSITLPLSVPWASKDLQNGKPKVRISWPSEFLFLHLSLTRVSIPWWQRLCLTHVLSPVPGTVWNLTRHMLLEPRWVSVPPSGPLSESRNCHSYLHPSTQHVCWP